MLSTDNLREADRLMTVCNSCRYCEGLCAVFPAMEMRRVFAEGDLNLLANLCHSCGACYDDCQFTPPHEFAVNVPQTLAKVRRDSWEAYVWPKAFEGTFRRNGFAVALTLALSVAAFLIGFAAWRDPQVLFGAHQGPGAFYRIMPHNVMALLFGGAFLYSVVALAMGVRTFWRDMDRTMPLKISFGSIWQAMKDAGSLRYLDGGGAGCFNDDDQPSDKRRLFHHLTFYGFLLCFAATSVATLYHYVLGREAPYPWYDLPVLLGTAGGVGLIVGPIGLMKARARRRAELKDEGGTSMDTAFTLMLLLTSVTGLMLLVLRETAAMGILLAVHLGVVFALFLTMPYGRFVHGIYRFVALVRYAAERKDQIGKS
jgi:citrate/tricarballylate utilization protein